MFRTLSDEEVKLSKDRVRELYMSKWSVDNVTAILMDMNVGNIGYNEAEARAKAHHIMGWIRTIVKTEIPERHE
jgi:hypothetical protein